MKSFAPPYRRAKPGLGTWIEITLTGGDEATGARATTAAFAEASRLEGILSAFDPRSELSGLNGALPGKAIAVSPELAQVLADGARVEALFPDTFRLMPGTPSGHYAIEGSRVWRNGPGLFELGGIAKGFIVDRVFEGLVGELGASARVVVNAGGDLRVSHVEPVEVRIPGRRAGFRATLHVSGSALATSSRLPCARHPVGRPSARYPGRPKAGKSSAVVIASTCLIADAFTKVALLHEGSLARRSGDLASLGVLGFEVFDREGDRLGYSPPSNPPALVSS